MALTSQQRDEIRGQLAQDWSKVWSETNLTKVELRAAIDRADDWIDTNGADFKSTINSPLSAEKKLTNGALTELLSYVARKKYLG